MPTLFAEDENKIFGEILFDVVNSTNLRRGSSGSKTRALVQAVSKKMGQMYRKFDVNVAQAFLSGAEGKYLDFLGDMFGVSRLGSEPAASASAERNVKFYVDVGTFAEINDGQSILLPSGTAVSTRAAGAGIVYTIPYNVILTSGSTETFVAAQASRPGTSQNIGANQLVYHNFINYTDVANNTLKVTNDAEVITGKDIESDVNFRFRIANAVVASEQANQTAVRISALSVPGVADIVLIPFHRGIGTFELLIKSTTVTVSEGLSAAVTEAVSKVIAQGIVPAVRGPTETGFSMVGTLRMRKKLSPSEESNILQSVQDNIVNYVNSLDIGEEFIVNEAVERVLGTSDQIKNVGVANKPFDSMYIYSPTKLEDNKIRTTLVGDYAPEVDERLIVEPNFAGDTPILFRISDT